MVDRIMVWHIPGVLSENVAGINVSTEFTADEDYVPVRVVLRQKTAQSGNETIVDINDDGTSIFDTCPVINQGITSTEYAVFSSGLTYIKKDSVITLDVDQVSETVPGNDLTVQLELNRE